MAEFRRLGALFDIEHAHVRALFDIEDAHGNLNEDRLLQELLHIEHGARSAGRLHQICRAKSWMPFSAICTPTQSSRKADEPRHDARLRRPKQRDQPVGRRHRRPSTIAAIDDRRRRRAEEERHRNPAVPNGRFEPMRDRDRDRARPGGEGHGEREERDVVHALGVRGLLLLPLLVLLRAAAAGPTRADATTKPPAMRSAARLTPKKFRM